jgi:hypothetical protein
VLGFNQTREKQRKSPLHQNYGRITPEIRRSCKSLIAQYSLQPTNKPKSNVIPARHTLSISPTESQEESKKDEEK